MTQPAGMAAKAADRHPGLACLLMASLDHWMVYCPECHAATGDHPGNTEVEQNPRPEGAFATR